ncbi:MAG: hypothetical protein LBB16_00830 [Puniceicoccales bacterium]|nr:hypothetical protein [Puniceicoccales bacterium]
MDFFINKWKITDTKNGEPIKIPLIEQTLEILDDRLYLKELTPWVFPSEKSKSGHLEEPMVAWKRILGCVIKLTGEKRDRTDVKG